MNDLFPLYMKAAALVAFALVLTVGVTAFARHLKVDFISFTVAWFRGLPTSFRAWRDPTFRAELERAAAEAETFGQYNAMNALLQQARTRHEHATHVLSHLVDPSMPGIMGRIHESAREEHEGKRTVVATYFARLTDADIVVIARGVNGEVFGGRVPQAEMEAFFREERERITRSEELADTHFVRMGKRFVDYVPQEAGAA